MCAIHRDATVLSIRAHLTLAFGEQPLALRRVLSLTEISELSDEFQRLSKRSGDERHRRIFTVCLLELGNHAAEMI